MVGVPGRSKACNTCRKRKIACSLERPRCFQCTKSGRHCLGYQKERVFVTSTPASNGYEASWRPDIYSKSSKPHADQVKQHILSRSPAVTSQWNLNRTTLRQNIVAEYMSTAFAQSGSRNSGWVTLIPGIPQPSKALELATYALCTARLGRTTNDHADQLLRESSKLYGAGLEAAQQALANPRLVFDDQTLGACLLLGMYEVFECPSNSRYGYLSHYEGISKLIQLRGPEKHKNGIGHAIFLSFRIMGILESLIRKETFLAEPEWKAVPFSEVSQTPLDRLLDRILEALPIMGLGDELARTNSPELKLERAIEIAKLCWQVDENLRCFFDEIEASTNGPLYWPAFPTRSGKIRDLEDESEELFPVEYHFSDLRTATTLVFYWSMQLILYSGMSQLYGLFDQLTGGLYMDWNNLIEPETNLCFAQKLGLPPLGNRTDILTPARNICQSVEFCVQDDLGISAVTGPLNIVINLLIPWPGYEGEIKWAKKALKRLRLHGVVTKKKWARPGP